METPNTFQWFLEEGITTFTPWSFAENLAVINEQFKKETIRNNEVITFAKRQDMDTFAGFEVISGVVTEKVIVFHPSFQQNIKDWDIISSVHTDIFDFISNVVLPDMKEWVKDELK